MTYTEDYNRQDLTSKLIFLCLFEHIKNFWSFSCYNQRAKNKAADECKKAVEALPERMQNCTLSDATSGIHIVM